MPRFIEVKGIIIAIDNITWIEYQTADEILAKAGGPGVLCVPPIEPEGRTYVLLRHAPEPTWIAGDVRSEFRRVLDPAIDSEAAVRRHPIRGEGGR